MFRTHDPEGDRLVAVKAFTIDLTPEQAAEVAAFFNRIGGVELANASVTAIIAAGVEDSVAYLAQQYVAGESLDAAVRQYGPAPPADAVRLITHVAAGLDAAAAAGLFHGSLHPRDILVTPGETHVTGLGVAMALESVGHRAPVRRPYAAPERESGSEWGAPADVFSLAAVAYEVLTGRRALPGTEKPLPGLVDVKALDVAALHDAMVAALDPAPERRPASASAFAASFAAGLTGSGRGPGHPAEKPSRQRRSRGRAARLPGLEDPLTPAVAAGAAGVVPGPEGLSKEGGAPVSDAPVVEPPDAEPVIEPTVLGATVSDAPVVEPPDAEPVIEPTALEEAVSESLVVEPADAEPSIVDAPGPDAELQDLAVTEGDYTDFDAPPEEDEPASAGVFGEVEEDPGEADVVMPAEAGEEARDLEEDLAGFEDLDADRAAGPMAADVDLSDLALTFTPEARELRDAGFAPDLEALSKALDGVVPPDDGLDAQAESEHAPGPGEEANHSDGVDREGVAGVAAEAGRPQVDDEPGFLFDPEEPVEPDDEPEWREDEGRRPADRETIDDYRDPGTLVSDPPIPRALDLATAGRHSRRLDPVPRPESAARRGYVVAGAVLLLVVVVALLGYWYGLSRLGGGAAANPDTAGGAPAAVETPAASPKPPAAPAGGAAAPATTAPAPSPAPSTPPSTPPSPSPAQGPAPVVPPSAPGEIRITSSPSTADVTVNGERRGVTPRVLKDLPLGTYTIRVSRPGYSPQERVITISPDRPTARAVFSLPRLRQAAPSAAPPAARPAARPPAAPARPSTPAPPRPGPSLGSISVETRPGGVRVFVDGRPAGISPLVVPDVAPGTHEIRLELQGYRPWVSTVTLTPGQRLRVTASLERTPSR